jgi:amino acid adenylation domain-containing protein
MTLHITEVENSLIVRFEQQVAIYSNNVAVKGGRNILSYLEINNIANHVATSILSRQKSKFKTVALLLEPCVMMPSALLGVWKAGYIIVPINASMPDERIKHILLDSKAEVIVTNNHNASYVNKLTNHTLSLINIDEIELENTIDNPEINQSEDLSACILYTSGSTGMPKGVLHNHQNLLHYTQWHTKSFGITNNDRLSLLFSYAFIPGLIDILRALLNGTSLSLYNPKDDDITDLSTWLKQEKISILHLSPAAFHQFQDSLEGGESFPSIRFIQLGGDAILESDVAFSKTDIFPNSTLSYGLGTTETGPLMGMRVSKNDAIPENRSLFSRPIDDKEILILDENNKPVVVGEVGIIAVKSQYLAVGYWQQKDLTQQRFFSTSDSNIRMYVTGDYGRFLPDGSLLFLGRKDNQFNIKGYRIEAGEIECAMMSIPEVKQALVQTWETKAGQKQLVGYIVLQAQQQLTASAIYQFLVNKLPTYMVPNRFILLDEMPLSENGKILRQALPAPDITRPNLNTLYSKPRNSSEKKLAAIMGEILGIDKIGIHDNFFELGGDSLAAVGLMAEIEEQFGKVLPLAILFELGTI